MNGIVFKGTRGGIEVLFDALAPFEAMKQELQKKLTENPRFFGKRADVRVSAVVGRELLDREKEELLEIFGEYFNANGVEFVSAAETGPKATAPLNGDATDQETLPEVEGSMFLFSTLRSGQKVECEGHIVVMGDVNPGAQLVAAGNIVVLGAMRGMAHAGALGDAGAVVFALNLQPTQLRIADMIAIAPKDEQKTGYPEIAHAYQGKIEIVPYDAGSPGRKQMRNV